VRTEQLAAGPAAGNARTAAVQPSVEAWNVHKSYGRRAALRGVDLSVQPGRTLAIVGPNGAGKTTLLRVLATLARPSSGTVRICGIDAVADPVAARRHVGVVLATTFLYDELTGAENLAHYARLYGVRDAGQRAAQLAEMLGVHGRLHDRVGTYSRGMAQRLAIARALLHRPEVLLLDEPDAGLDPAATAELPRLLRGDGARSRAIVLTCHDLHLALAVADDVAILAHGRFAFAAPTTSLTPAALRHAYASVASTP
jgi:ABC-type multidrug transport system ATPase subunit